MQNLAASDIPVLQPALLPIQESVIRQIRDPNTPSGSLVDPQSSILARGAGNPLAEVDNWRLHSVSLLLNQSLTPSARLIWICLKENPASAQAPASQPGPSVQIPPDLLPTRRPNPTAKLLYGFLQLTRAPLAFTLLNPALQRQEAALNAAVRRLPRARFDGEAIMREYLNVLVDSDEFPDNVRPGFLVNPYTGERMEFDRYYPPHVALEFQGPQRGEGPPTDGPGPDQGSDLRPPT